MKVGEVVEKFFSREVEEDLMTESLHYEPFATWRSLGWALVGGRGIFSPPGARWVVVFPRGAGALFVGGG